MAIRSTKYLPTRRAGKHNLNYWLFGDYLAVGAGAHGKLTTQDEIYRYQKPANPLQYMKFQETDDPEITRTVLDRDDLMFEFMLNALRLNDGFAENVFLQRTGLSTSDLIDATRNARQRGLIERDNNEIWKPTELGGRFLNDLQSEFIVERA